MFNCLYHVIPYWQFYVLLPHETSEAYDFFSPGLQCTCILQTNLLKIFWPSHGLGG